MTIETWWKLPDSLGGSVVKQVDEDGQGVYVEVSGMTYALRIRTEDLTPAKPPAPPEPDRHATLLDRTGRAWQGLDGGVWKCVDGAMYTWTVLWDRRGPITVLTSPMSSNEVPNEADTDVTWVGYTVSGTKVKVFKEFAIGRGRKQTDRRIRVEVTAPGSKTVFLSFMPGIALDLSDALQRSIETKS